MKKSILLALLLLAALGPAFAYNTVTVQDSIQGNVHWTNDQQYLLKGYVYVVSGATLTIDSGVTIRGDKATKGTLIVERGAKIYANGTKALPIIFTSNEPAGGRNYGDWGGVILCGKSPTNWTTQDKQVEGGPRSLYGGTDPSDNSGRLSYVRIEFGGIAFSQDNEVNSLSLYAVGNGTQIDHIQTSYSGDDGFEWFGGTVNTKYLVAFRTVDDDFDNDNNYSGKNQFVVAIRDPFTADAVSGGKSIESDSYLGGTYSGLPYVAAQGNTSVFSNLTLIGPLQTPTTLNYSPNHIAAVHIRRGSGISVLNSVIAGFPVGVLFDESAAAYGSTTANIGSGTLQFRNNLIAGIRASAGQREVFYVKDGARNNTPTATWADTLTGGPFSPAAGPVSFLTTPSFGNKIYATEAGGSMLNAPFILGNPNLIPKATSPILTGGVLPDFTTTKASDAWFDKVNYVGAFGTDNWMDTWTEFDPINENYDILRQGPATAIGNIPFLSAMTVYPNPSAGTANVRFELTKSSVLTINLYDLTGKLVKAMFNGEKASGAHTVSLDLSGLQTGLYTVRMATSNGQKSVPLVIAQ